jgi:hypothetical protein
MIKRGPEVDGGLRAVIADSRKPLRDISNRLNMPKSTCHDIRRATHNRAKRTKLPVCHSINQAPYYRSGRPQVLSLREKDLLILHATMNKKQRAKPWKVIAAELELHAISESVINNVFYDRGYSRCHATHKPYLSQTMKDNRFAWTSDRRFWKVEIRADKDWSNVMFTDETPIPLGLQNLIHNVTRLPEEKWNDHCCVSDFKKPIQLQFYGAIAYN